VGLTLITGYPRRFNHMAETTLDGAPIASGTDPFEEIKNQYSIHLFRLSTPVPVLSVNIYFAEEPVPTLIDVPAAGGARMEELESSLRALSHSVSDIRRIVVTHAHTDHDGLAHQIVKESGAEIWVSKGGATWIEHYEEECRAEEVFIVESLKKAGVPEDRVEESLDFFRYLASFGGQAKATRYLTDGDKFRLSSLDLTVEMVPGHTPWCTLFYDRQAGIAFTGDFLLKHITSNPVLQRARVAIEGFKSVRSYMASLTRMRDMHLRVALPGHGEAMVNPSERAQALIDFMVERKGHVLATVKAGGSTPFEMVEELFSWLSKDQLFLAISEVMAYIDALEDEGLVERIEGPVLRIIRTNESPA
jgi:glyoxylase-like metal-dependent hydrolase (beta-lactamase superfamily II)